MVSGLAGQRRPSLRQNNSHLGVSKQIKQIRQTKQIKQVERSVVKFLLMKLLCKDSVCSRCNIPHKSLRTPGCLVFNYSSLPHYPVLYEHVYFGISADYLAESLFFPLYRVSHVDRSYFFDLNLHNRQITCCAWPTLTPDDQQDSGKKVICTPH